MELTLNKSAGKPWAITDAYPGWTSDWEYMDVYNTGSLPFEAQLSVNYTSGDTNLYNWVNITMKTSGWDSDCTNGDGGEKVLYTGPINAFTNGMTASDIAYWHLANEDDASGGPDNIRAGWTERICQQVGVDSAADNTVQGVSTVFVETVDAVQDND